MPIEYKFHLWSDINDLEFWLQRLCWTFIGYCLKLNTNDTVYMVINLYEKFTTLINSYTLNSCQHNQSWGHLVVQQNKARKCNCNSFNGNKYIIDRTKNSYKTLPNKIYCTVELNIDWKFWYLEES